MAATTMIGETLPLGTKTQSFPPYFPSPVSFSSLRMYSPIGVAKELYKADGITGFWRGLPPTLVGIIPARSVYFYSYDLTKNTLKPKIGLGSLNAAISGIMAGFTSNTVTNPIWMVKTRMQLLSDTTVGQKAYTSYSDAVKTIYKEEGLGGFYRGITASYWGCAEGCVQFVLYEKLKAKLVDRENNRRKAAGMKSGENGRQI